MRNEASIKHAVLKTAKSFSGAVSMVAVGAVIAATSVSAHAATPDYSAFKTALKASGVPSDDGVSISFPLFRQDLSLTISLDGGLTSYPAPSESVAVGYISVEKTGPGMFFFTGAFPALTKELPALEATLEDSGLPITSVAQQVAGLSKEITTVHIEGSLTESDTALANAFANVVKTIKDPQKNLTITAASPSLPSLPPKFQNLVDSGAFELLDSNVLLFELPRQDMPQVTFKDAGAGTSVPATPSLGFLTNVFISGYGYSVLNAEIPLAPSQIQFAEDMLVKAGFTISSTGDYYTDASKKITFLHVVATSATQDGFYSQGEALGQVLAKIK